jgi:hypothetical protein
MGTLLQAAGRGLASYLTGEQDYPGTVRPTRLESLAAALQPGDVLLVEGRSRISTAIKYLTQSTWSHAALYVGALPAPWAPDSAPTPDPFSTHRLVEADVREGVRSVSLSFYASFPTRICRPVGLDTADRQALVSFVTARLGHQYDLRNVWDLARYLIPTPPVPVRWRRQMLSLGSGDPTRAICSTLVAQAFQSIRYPILPDVAADERGSERLRRRHHSLFTPRDFDVSPYFQIIKPTLSEGFNFHRLQWV